MTNKKMITIMAIVWILLIPAFNSIPNIAAQAQPTLSLNPAQVSITDPSNTFTLDFKISGVTDLWGWVANVTWDSQYINMTKAPKEGDFFSNAGHSTAFQVGKVNTTLGTYSREIGDTGLDNDAVSGDGKLVSLTFQVLKPVASTTITVTAEKLLTNITTGTGTGGITTLPTYETLITPYPASISTSTTISYIPSGGAPVADAGPDQTVNQFTNVILNASKTIPQDATSQTYTWTFFDNQSRTLTGMVTNYTFFWPGITNITLTVTNSKGSSNATTSITVKDTTPPVAIITMDNYPNQIFPVNQYIHFSSNQSYDPYNLTISNYWDFGDGATSNDPNVSHRYLVAGTYNISLTATNGVKLSATTIKTIVIGDASTTPNPSATDTSSPSGTMSPSSGANPTRDANIELNTQSFNLPPTILYPLIFATVFALGGATIWLRKKT